MTDIKAPGSTTTRAPRADQEFTVRRRSQTQLVLRRFLRHRAAVISLILFLLITLWAFLGPYFWHYSYSKFTPDNSQPPSLKHPFGTDSSGYDAYAQVMRGTQTSLKIAIMIALGSTVVGAVWGAIAGYYRGIVDAVMMRIADLVLTLPLLAIALVISSRSGGSWYAIAIVIAGLTWAYVARVVRSSVLSLREKEFVEAARALGSSDARIIFRHLLPNALGPIIVNATVLVATGILTETALSFLGFGVQPPDTSLGLLVAQAQTAVDTRPWLFYIPGVFIIAIALTVNFIGDGLRDAFDPRQQRVRQ
ncbi:ABC transporter permease [Streptomyces sp. TRM68367]|uniref:ABC transporter permease n=1 Tax=Streptomyces sp. TRM68367 TaxID=2758415 RepID=UPI00165C6EB5|nr:ABC transporter permease [Streptomyces sp. TRM68367]MBC9727664.1 ABC transporter permease [Streptomyces sp. TRM68367]